MIDEVDLYKFFENNTLRKSKQITSQVLRKFLKKNGYTSYSCLRHFELAELVEQHIAEY